MEREILLQAALQLHRLNYNLMPLRAGTKLPLLKEWKIRQEQRLTRVELQSLFRRGRDPPNLAVICGETSETPNVLVIDYDGKDEPFPRSSVSVMSSKGRHDYWQLLAGQRVPNTVRFQGLAVDFRNQGGYAVAPPSWNAEAEFRYEWVNGVVPAKDLPVFPAELVKEISSTGGDCKQARVDCKQPVTRDRLIQAEKGRPLSTAIRAKGDPEAAWKYVRNITAVQGHRDNTLFRIACILIQNFELPFDLALNLIERWDRECCKPPIEDEKRYLYKLSEAERLK